MSPKRQRLLFLLLATLMIGGSVALVLRNFSDNLVFFYSPSEIKVKATVGQKVRIGGLVKAGSFRKDPKHQSVSFVLTDTANSIPVHYTGMLPSLFREGQGVVAEGTLQGDGTFEAATILAKHDERYMPPEVAKAIRDSGHWKGKK